MAYEFSFEKLQVWQIARSIVADIYKVTEKFPNKETFGLVSQMKRSAVSVCANIAEGSTKTTPRDQARFTSIAYGSLIELLNHLILSSDLGYIPVTELVGFKQKIQLLSVKINNLRIRQISLEKKK
jgi:four helix bundle protein